MKHYASSSKTPWYAAERARRVKPRDARSLISPAGNRAARRIFTHSTKSERLRSLKKEASWRTLCGCRLQASCCRAKADFPPQISQLFFSKMPDNPWMRGKECGYGYLEGIFEKKSCDICGESALGGRRLETAALLRGMRQALPKRERSSSRSQRYKAIQPSRRFFLTARSTTAWAPHWTRSLSCRDGAMLGWCGLLPSRRSAVGGLRPRLAGTRGHRPCARDYDVCLTIDSPCSTRIRFKVARLCNRRRKPNSAVKRQAANPRGASRAA